MQIGSTDMVTQDWDSAWDSDHEDEPDQESIPTKNRASIEEEKRHSQLTTPVMSPPGISSGDDQDDAADAWGWGDDDTTEETLTQKEDPQSAAGSSARLDQKHAPEMRELTLSEPYWTSSLPKPVLNTVVDLFNDGALLTRPEQVPDLRF